MEQLNELITALRGKSEHGYKPLSPEEYEQLKANAYNESIGNLNETDGYNCDLCKNKGYIAKVKYEESFGYYSEVFTPCKCQRIRAAIHRLNRSGLKNIVKDYTFEKYITDEPWRESIKAAAMQFCKDDKNTWFFIGGQSGCVDADTEFFNGYKWVKISEYNGEDVLQYDPETKTASLVEPKRYIKNPASELYQISTLRGSIDMQLSADHNFAYMTTKGHMAKKPFAEVMKIHAERTQGFYGKIETAFCYGGKGIELTENEIRLMCAVIADGSFRKKLQLCTVNVKKERKKQRMRELLSGTQYKEYPKKNGYSEFRFYAPRREKVFSDYWYGCSNEQLSIIVDEVFKWDGSEDKRGRKHFFSTVKENADFVQFAISATGSRATISVDQREGRTTCYTVLKAQGKSLVSMVSTGGRTKAKIEKVTTKDGYQYCFEVDTGYLILRRNGRIFVTGNSGKSHLCSAIAVHYIRQGKEVKYMLWRDEIAKLKALSNDPEHDELMKELKETSVLYIDDLFKNGKDRMGNVELPTAADVQHAFEILNYRYNNPELITIISSERTLVEMNQIDEAIAGRIAERTKAAGYCLNIKRDPQRNWRMKDLLEI